MIVNNYKSLNVYEKEGLVLTSRIRLPVPITEKRNYNFLFFLFHVENSTK